MKRESTYLVSDPCSLVGFYQIPAETTCDATEFRAVMESIQSGAVAAGCDLSGESCPTSCETYLREMARTVHCMQGDWKYLAQSIILEVESQSTGVPPSELSTSIVYAMRACDRLVLDVGKWDFASQGTSNGTRNEPKIGQESGRLQNIVDLKSVLILGILSAWIALKYLIIVLS